MINGLKRIHDGFGKSNCIFFGIICLLESVVLLFLILFLEEFRLVCIIFCIFSIVLSVFFFCAGADWYEEAPHKDIPPVPFFHSLDQAGNHILSNGKKTVSVGSDGELRSDTPLTKQEQRQVIYTLMDLASFSEGGADREDDGNALYGDCEVRRQLELLRSLYDDDLIEEEEYREKKAEILEKL